MLSLNLSTLIAILSTLMAVVSLIFSWKAVKAAERSNFAGVYTELYKIYLEPKTLEAIKKIWEMYSAFEGHAVGQPITDQQAYELVTTLDRDSLEWHSIHLMSLFWRYVSILVKKNYLDREVAFEAFTSPRMLGFLAPIEYAFLRHHYSYTGKREDLPLHWLYNLWQKYRNKKS